MAGRVETHRSTSRFVGYAAPLLIAAGTVQAAIGVATSTLVPELARPGTEAFYASGAILTVAHGMLVLAFVALAATDVAGRGWLGRIGYGLTFLGLMSLVLGESLLRVDFNTGNGFFGLSVPASAAGLIVLGVAVVLAHRWTGWRRVSVLICGLYIPVILIPAFILAAGPSFAALAGWSVCFLLVGLAAREEVR